MDAATLLSKARSLSSGGGYSWNQAGYSGSYASKVTSGTPTLQTLVNLYGTGQSTPVVSSSSASPTSAADLLAKASALSGTSNIPKATQETTVAQALASGQLASYPTGSRVSGLTIGQEVAATQGLSSAAKASLASMQAANPTAYSKVAVPTSTKVIQDNLKTKASAADILSTGVFESGIQTTPLRFTESSGLVQSYQKKVSDYTMDSNAEWLSGLYRDGSKNLGGTGEYMLYVVDKGTAFYSDLDTAKAQAWLINQATGRNVEVLQVRENKGDVSVYRTSQGEPTLGTIETASPARSFEIDAGLDSTHIQDNPYVMAASSPSSTTVPSSVPSSYAVTPGRVSNIGAVSVPSAPSVPVSAPTVITPANLPPSKTVEESISRFSEGVPEFYRTYAEPRVGTIKSLEDVQSAIKSGSTIPGLSIEGTKYKQTDVVTRTVPRVRLTILSDQSASNDANVPRAFTPTPNAGVPGDTSGGETEYATSRTITTHEKTFDPDTWETWNASYQDPNRVVVDAPENGYTVDNSVDSSATDELLSGGSVKDKLVSTIVDKYPDAKGTEQLKVITEDIPEIGLAVADGSMSWDNAVELINDIHYLYRTRPNVYHGAMDWKNALSRLAGEWAYYHLPAEYIGFFASDSLEGSDATFKPPTTSETFISHPQTNPWLEEYKPEARDYFNSDQFKKDVQMNTPFSLSSEDITQFFNDPSHELVLSGVGMLIGGVTGLALKGAAAGLGGVLMGQFAGTELSNLMNSNIFADSKLEAAAGTGYSALVSKSKTLSSKMDGIQKQYNQAIKDGDLVAADRYLAELRKVNAQYAEFVDDNWIVLYKAGLYEDAVSDVANVERSILERDPSAAEKYVQSDPIALPDYVPGQDVLKINEYNYEHMSKSEIRLPPGNYEVTLQRRGYEPVTYLVTVETDGSYSYAASGGVSAAGVEESVDSADAKTAADKSKDGLTYDPTREQDITVAAKQAAYAAGVNARVVLPPGWKMYDPYLRQWVDQDHVTYYAAGSMQVYAIDPEGNIRYLTQTIVDPALPPSFVFTDQLKIIGSINPDDSTATTLTDQLAERDFAKSHANLAALNVPSGATWQILGFPESLSGDQWYKDLDPGSYRLQVTKADGSTYTKDVTLYGGELKTIDLSPPASTQLKVYVQTGQTAYVPGLSEPLTAGTHTIEVTPGLYDIVYYQEGYDPESVSVNAIEGTTKTVSGQGKETYDPYASGKLYEEGRAAGKAETSYSSSSGGSSGGSYSPQYSNAMFNIATEETKQYGTIAFGPTTVGASVWLDDEQIAPEIDVEYQLLAGYHALVMKKTGYQTYTKTIYIIKDQLLYISPVFDVDTSTTTTTTTTTTEEEDDTTYWKIAINAEPQGAKIMINGAWTGNWTPSTITLEEGLYEVGLIKTGYVDFYTALWVGATPLWGDAAVTYARSLGYDV